MYFGRQLHGLYNKEARISSRYTEIKSTIYMYNYCLSTEGLISIATNVVIVMLHMFTGVSLYEL
jgi:hypothetical protein